MKLKMFAVLDAKVGFFGIPFCDHREESAIRRFSDDVNDSSNPSNQWYRHPEDFALYCIGDYDTETASITPLPALRAIVTASALKAAVAPSQSEFPFSNNGKEKSVTVQ